MNRAYVDRPESTEQILHPEKYLRREAPLPVRDTPLAKVLGPDWTLLQADVLGEWTTFLILGSGGDAASQLYEGTAVEAADGWGGDEFQVYYRPSTEDTLLAVHWVWDTQRDANEFDQALHQHLEARFRGARLDRGDGACWEANGQTNCVFSSGAQTLWLLAPDQDTLITVARFYPDFR